jgi:hypothetical protein
METIAIVGAGRVGGNLGERLARSGCGVRFGIRDSGDAEALLARAGQGAVALAPAEAVKEADVVFLAVPAVSALDAVRGLGPMEGKVLVDCTNPVVWREGPVWSPPPEGSVAAALAAALPGAEVVKGFNVFGAEIHLDPWLAGARAAVPLAGDSAEAKARVAALAERAGFTPLDAGPLRNAGLLESLAVLWIHLATVGGRGRDWAFTVSGRG